MHTYKVGDRVVATKHAERYDYALTKGTRGNVVELPAPDWPYMLIQWDVSAWDSACSMDPDQYKPEPKVRTLAHVKHPRKVLLEIATAYYSAETFADAGVAVGLIIGGHKSHPALSFANPH